MRGAMLSDHAYIIILLIIRCALNKCTTMRVNRILITKMYLKRCTTGCMIMRTELTRTALPTILYYSSRPSRLFVVIILHI